MKRLRSSFWLNSIFYTLLQRFSLMFFNTVAFMLIVRAVGKQEFSVWALYVTIYMSFEIIKQGLLRNPTIKFLSMPEYAGKKSEVHTASLSLNMALTLLAIFLILFFNGAIVGFLKTPGLGPVLWWSIPYLIILIPFSHAEVILQANFQFQKIFTGYILRQGLFFASVVLMFFVYRNEFTVIHLVIIQVSASLAGMLMLVYQAWPFFARPLRFERAVTRSMFHFGKYIFGTNLSVTLSRSLDQFITANAVPDAAIRGAYVSYYSTVNRVNTLIDVPSLAAADVLFPKNVETLETDGLGRVKYYFERMIGTILCVIVPISLLIFLAPKLIILLLAGREYLGAAYILQITILFSLVRPLSYQFGSTLDAIGRPQINFWVNLLMLAINLGLNYAFLIRFGAIGAAYATIAFYLISLVIMIVILRKFVHLEPGKIILYMAETYGRIYRIARNFMRKKNGSGESASEGT